MTLARRERFLLGVLVVMVLLWGGRQLLVLLSGADLGLGVGGARRRAAAGYETQVAELRLRDLEPRSSSFTPGRDPFSFGVAPPPPAPPPPPRRRGQERAVPPPAPQGPRIPDVPLQYLGSFGSESRRIAVFAEGETIHNAMAGEVLNGQFIVDRIGYESVDIKFVGFPDAEAKRLAAGG